MQTEKGTILKITAGKIKDGFSAEIISDKKIKSVAWCVKAENGVISVKGEEKSGKISACFKAEEWSAEKPVLYTFETEIEYENGEKEELCDRFGFRWFETDENYIYLNGYPFYMRAYIRGAAAHEHENNCNLSKYEFYKKNILSAKEYGFNAVRFHTTIPPEECFRAADEYGMLIHIEMRKDKADYDNLEEMLYGK